MKNYSQYFKAMITLSLIFMLLFILCMPQFVGSPELGAITAIMSFIFWFGAVMAPDHEKYKLWDMMPQSDKVRYNNSIEYYRHRKMVQALLLK